ncbi:LuxR C-terminal-related transcriptional regulator [Novosphingobium sp. Fuku2-ISO-50]|uniref:LuxR C-terminal-related transcriptional regulator n=1 Tax=Novosphingobium sp. Fuku2-ISO-50 TaxID=1739114 RepID=UPI0009EA93E5|nr:helix-turn-helix transcriptional regulator [Novosphingobium sp. Fuku2-ISO-50]MDR3414338.1 helix-turn-helix transcriptional regulator [Formivibrio sp.]
MGGVRGLSPQQRRVLDLMTTGYTNKEIAKELGISSRTVEVHRALALRCLGARTSFEAVVIWDRAKRVTSPLSDEGGRDLRHA